MIPALDAQPGDPLADSPERAELRRLIRKLIEDVAPDERTNELDESETFDQLLYSKLAELGLLGIDAPEELGGSGDVRDQLVVVEELAKGRWKVNVRWNSQPLLRDVILDLDDETALLIPLPEAAKSGGSALFNPARR